jgi:DNA-binding beta-propeller fold protein YncE
VQGGGARAVDSSGAIVWNYVFSDLRDTALYLPRDAQLLPNGNVLVSDYGKNRVLEIDPTTNTIVWEWLSSNSSPASAVPALPEMPVRTYVPLAASSYGSGW